MNFRVVLSQLGILFLVLSIVLLAMAAGFYGIEAGLAHRIDVHAQRALLISGAIGLVLGGVAWALTRNVQWQVGRREALLLVGVSWLLGAAFAALPFYLWAIMSPHAGELHPFQSFWSCYFEAMSGLTTTGASVLSDVESLPRSLLLWRAVTHWLGGLGIVVLFVAVLPSLGAGGRRLFRSEASGLSKEGVRPHIRDTARTLWFIYLGLTVAAMLLFVLAGMPWFDAICHGFSTIATGGFSTRNASIGAYHSLLIESVALVFMIASGVNFGLYYAIIRGRYRVLFKDPELRLYLILLASGTIIVAASLYATGQPISQMTGDAAPATLSNSVRYAAFSVTAVQTTTGYATADYGRWPFAAHAVLILLMFLGGSAGSTSGGLKVIRFWAVFKILHREIERAFRPQIVRPVMVGERSIDPDLKLGTLAFALGYIMLFAIGAVAIMIAEQANSAVTSNFTTAATASLATLSNVGPGLDLVGPLGNYGWFTTPSKIIMSLLMALGRVEIFAIIVLFTPRFWRGT